MRNLNRQRKRRRTKRSKQKKKKKDQFSIRLHSFILMGFLRISLVCFGPYVCARGGYSSFNIYFIGQFRMGSIPFIINCDSNFLWIKAFGQSLYVVSTAHGIYALLIVVKCSSVGLLTIYIKIALICLRKLCNRKQCFCVLDFALATAKPKKKKLIRDVREMAASY